MEGGRKVLDVGYWVVVGDSDLVQRTIVSTGMPIARLFLWDHMQGEGPIAAGWMDNA